jgi:hypothetical protein
MIVALIAASGAALAVQPAPLPVRPVVAVQQHPPVSVSLARKQQVVLDADALVARAQSAPTRLGARIHPDERSQLEQTAAALKAQRDDLSELGEMQQLRLQMSMDRTSKLMETLSNLLKKLGDTEGSITNNIK